MGKNCVPQTYKKRKKIYPQKYIKKVLEEKSKRNVTIRLSL